QRLSAFRCDCHGAALADLQKAMSDEQPRNAVGGIPAPILGPPAALLEDRPDKCLFVRRQFTPHLPTSIPLVGPTHDRQTVDALHPKGSQAVAHHSPRISPCG